MKIKDLPLDYGERFNNFLLHYVTNLRKQETTELQLARFLQLVVDTCVHCKQLKREHAGTKCLFDTTSFEAILEEEPGSLMRQYLLIYLENPTDTWKQEYLGHFPSGE